MKSDQWYFKQKLVLMVLAGGLYSDYIFEVEKGKLRKGKERWELLFKSDIPGEEVAWQLEGDVRYGMLTTRNMQLFENFEELAHPCEYVVKECDDLFEKKKKAIKLLQAVCPPDEMVEVAFSGGKDSTVCLDLAREAKINFAAFFHNTTVEAPGVVAFVRSQKDVIISQPEKKFFKIVEENGMPNRFQRTCCRFLKEYKILEKRILGVRKAESWRRNERYDEPVVCGYLGAEKDENYVQSIYPVLYWSDEDIVNYCNYYGVKLSPMYYDIAGDINPTFRVGCLCCPLKSVGKRLYDFKKYPYMLRGYLKALRKYRETHAHTKTVMKYRDEYEWLYREIFFRCEEDWMSELMKGACGGARPDYKKNLEDYFNITLQ